jgi:hypothetical protein
MYSSKRFNSTNIKINLTGHILGKHQRPYKPGIRSSDHCQQLTTSLTHYPNTTHVN